MSLSLLEPLFPSLEGVKVLFLSNEALFLLFVLLIGIGEFSLEEEGTKFR